MTEIETLQSRSLDSLSEAIAAELPESEPKIYSADNETSQRSIWDVSILAGSVSVIGAAAGGIENLAGMQSTAEHALQLSGDLAIATLAVAGLTFAWRSLRGYSHRG